MGERIRTATDRARHVEGYRPNEWPILREDDDGEESPCVTLCARCRRRLSAEQVVCTSVHQRPAANNWNTRSKARSVRETVYLCWCGHEQVSRLRVECRERWAAVSRWSLSA